MNLVDDKSEKTKNIGKRQGYKPWDFKYIMG